jgi:hypothetical protein
MIPRCFDRPRTGVKSRTCGAQTTGAGPWSGSDGIMRWIGAAGAVNDANELRARGVPSRHAVEHGPDVSAGARSRLPELFCGHTSSAVAI